MLRPLIVYLTLSLFALVAFPARTFAQVTESPIYGPLPVFEFHSGFWVNLHHTLYQEAKFRTPQAVQPSSSRQTAHGDDGQSTPRPALKTSPYASAPLTPDEQRAWNDALNYYATNYID